MKRKEHGKSKVLKTLVSTLLFCCFAGFINQSYFLPMMFAWLCHEAGHIFAARLFKIKLRPHTYKIFGISLTSGTAYYAYKEAVIALAGPACNFLVAYFFYKHNYHYIYQSNLALAFGNLVPILPLDGGKFLRAFFSRYCSWLWLTKVLVYSTQVMAFCLGAAIVWFGLNPWLWYMPLLIYCFAVLEGKNANLVFYQGLIGNCNVPHRPLRIIFSRGDMPVYQVIKRFSPGYENQVRCHLGSKQNISESRILEAWLENKGHLLLKEL